MQAVILAAGDGKRMMPLTKDKPKLLIKVAGKPLIDYILTSLREVGIEEVILIIGYLKEQIIDYLSDQKNIKFVVQAEKKGTAHAVSLAEPYIKNDFLVLNGDVLFEKRAIANFLSEHRLGEIAILSKQVEDPRPYGVLLINDGKIIDIIEKPQNPPSNLISSGAYIFPKQIFDAIKQTRRSQRGEFEITDSIKLLINSGTTARPVNYIGMRIELTQPFDIKRAEDWLKQNS